MNLVAGVAGQLLLSGQSAGDAVWHPVSSWHGALLLLGIGVCATSAQIAMTRAYRLGNTLVVANLQYSGIIFSSVWGVIIFGDAFGWHSWSGIAIIPAVRPRRDVLQYPHTERGKAIATTDPIASEV